MLCFITNISYIVLLVSVLALFGFKYKKIKISFNYIKYIQYIAIISISYISIYEIYNKINNNTHSFIIEIISNAISYIFQNNNNIHIIIKCLIGFLYFAIMLVITSLFLIKNIDKLSDETGASKGILGFILVSFCTSIPELFTSINSSIYFNNNDIVLGNIFGSNITNIVILAILDVILVKTTLWDKVPKSNLVPGLMAISFQFIILLMLITNIYTYEYIYMYKWIILVLYIVIIIAVYKQENNSEDSINKEWYFNFNLFKILVKLSISCIILFYSSLFLSEYVSQITQISIYGIKFNQTIAGNIFMAITTSMPELISIIIIVKSLKDYNMAFNGIFGSNIFNLFIIGIIDIIKIFFYQSPILYLIDYKHISTCLVGIIFNIIILITIKIQLKHKLVFISLPSIIIYIIYIINLILLYK